MGVSPAVTACSLTINLHERARTLQSELPKTWPVVKTTVTSTENREMQVRTLPRELRPCSRIGKTPDVRCRMFPGLNKTRGADTLVCGAPALAG